MSLAFFNARKRQKKNPRLQFRLKDENTLIFKLRNFHSEDLFNVYKRLKKSEYEVTIFQLESLLRLCQENKLEVIALPENVENALSFEADASFNEEFKESPIYKIMFKYQQDGVESAIRFGSRVLLADEMGLGKTLQAIAVVKYHNHSKVLIITPAYLRYTWKHELNKWLDDIDICIINKGTDEMRPDTFLIISYELASKRAAELSAMNFEIVICDESHYLKGHRTKRTKNLTPVVKKIPHVLLLTGTPALNRPCELFPQAHILRPSYFKKWKPFTVRYCDGQISPLGYYDFSGASNQEELVWMMRKLLMIRRVKRDVLTELPAKRRSEMYIPLPKTKTKKLGPLFDEWKKLNRMIPTMVPCSDEIKSAGFRRKCIISELFRLTSIAKADVVTKIVKDMADQGLQFIVFCYHQSMMDSICTALKCSFIRIDGATPQEKRQDMVDKFQSGGAQVAVLSLLAASTGLTLTATSLVLFAELYFVPGTILQAEDRVHRVGQTKVCDIRYIIAEGSLDDYIFKMLYQKLQTLDSVLDGRNDREFKGERIEWNGLDIV
jgi:SWI/SNF-related matrix-associated actin-dependent regulator 1 of chromatin subfamily A